jgi:hypothetical protein
MLLTFLSRSWIDFLTSFICLFESSMRSPITLTVGYWIVSQTFRPIHYLWVYMLNCSSGSLEGRHCLDFNTFKFLTVIYVSVGISFLFTSLCKQRNYCRQHTTVKLVRLTI